MKKLTVIGALILTVVVAFSAVGYAFAQTANPPAPQTTPQAWGRGMMRGNGSGQGNGSQGMMRGRQGGFGGGLMDANMISALAAGLGMKVEDLQAAITTGKTPYQVAQEKGLTADQIKDVFLKAHDTALAAAVAAGTMTKEQATWMDQRMESMFQSGFVPGSGMGQGGGRWNNQPAVTPAPTN